jgi:hypothetical protein
LKHPDAINTHKQKLTAMYHQILYYEWLMPNTLTFTISSTSATRVDELKTYLYEQNIGREIHYPVSPHQQKALLPLLDGQSFPISGEIHQITLSLSSSYCHTERDSNM